jgi:hypothetical protein
VRVTEQYDSGLHKYGTGSGSDRVVVDYKASYKSAVVCGATRPGRYRSRFRICVAPSLPALEIFVFLIPPYSHRPRLTPPKDFALTQTKANVCD